MASDRPHLFVPAALLLVTWGGFAFGAEFAWAYWPLLVFSVPVALLGALAGRGLPDSVGRAYGPILAAVLLIGAAVGLQMAPLPPTLIAAVSPARNNVDYGTLYAKETLQEPPPTGTAPRTLSIAPSRTALGLVFLGVLSALMIGAARGFSAVRATTFSRGIVIIGAVAAGVLLFERTTGYETVYGFFPLRQENSEQVAPFINRNHTAGFLCMTLAMALGHLASCLARGWRTVGPDARSRLLWFGSPAAAESMLVIFAALMMATSIIATQSRSGLLCLCLVLGIFVWQILRARWSTAWKFGAAAALLVVVATAFAAGGITDVISRFDETPLKSRGGRAQIWGMTLTQIRDFPLTGTGLNTFGIASLHYQTTGERRYVEAHNDYLQLASEGGLLVGVPALILLGTLVVTIRRRFAAGVDDTRTHWLRVGAVTALLAMALQSVFDFTLQMPGAAVLFVLLTAIAIHKPWLTSREA